MKSEMHIRHACGDVQQAVGCRSLEFGVETYIWEQPAYRWYSEPGGWTDSSREQGYGGEAPRQPGYSGVSRSKAQVGVSGILRKRRMDSFSCQHVGKTILKKRNIHDTVEWGKRGWHSVHRGQASEGHPDLLPWSKGDNGVFAGTGRCLLLVASVFLSGIEAQSFIN